LGEAAEEELLLASLLEPLLRPRRMNVPAPQKRQLDIRIKEIQRVHISAHCSGPLSGPKKR
jgi:hypothetical protein